MADEKNLEKTAKAEKTEKKAKNADKNQKPNIFVRFGRKVKEVFSELKRVTWPTFPKALKATGVVLVVTVAFTLIVTGIDVGLGALLDLLTRLGG